MDLTETSGPGDCVPQVSGDSCLVKFTDQDVKAAEQQINIAQNTNQ